MSSFGLLSALASLGWQPAGHQLRSRRPSHESFRVEMGAEHSARSREIAAEFVRERSTGVDVTAAAATGERAVARALALTRTRTRTRILALAWPCLALDPTLHPTPHRRHAVASLLEEDEQRERTLDALFTRPPAVEGDTHDGGDGDAHVWERDALVGQIRSSELLALDEKAGLGP